MSADSYSFFAEREAVAVIQLDAGQIKVTPGAVRPSDTRDLRVQMPAKFSEQDLRKYKMGEVLCEFLDQVIQPAEAA